MRKLNGKKRPFKIKGKRSNALKREEEFKKERRI